VPAGIALGIMGSTRPSHHVEVTTLREGWVAICLHIREYQGFKSRSEAGYSEVIPYNLHTLQTYSVIILEIK
jgi:hypothetical protein